MGYTHGKKWTDDIVSEKIKLVMSKLKIKKRMPTNKECISVMGNCSLSNRISKLEDFIIGQKN